MILVLASWMVMCFVFTVHGTVADQLLRLESANPLLKILTGIIVQTVLLSVCAFIVPLGPGLFAANLGVTMLLAFVYLNKLKAVYQDLAVLYHKTSLPDRLLLTIVVFTALLKCSQFPFILDNESYYLQTIRWINEYGMVTGLANFNIAFAQSSGWHILQAGFNGSFFTDRLNDINGFLLVVCSLWFVTSDREAAIGGIGKPAVIFVLLFNVLLYQFINAPSPDLPLILLSQVAFFLFLRSRQSSDKLIILLLIFLAFLKITILPFLLIIPVLLYRRRSLFWYTLCSGFVFVTLYVAKSLVLTGYPLYPLPLFPLDADWTIPPELLRFISDMVYDHEFLGVPGYKQLGMWERLWLWISFGGISGIMNKLILVLFAAVPFSQSFRVEKRFRQLYLILLIHFILVLFTSPQFRFFLPELIFLGTIITSELVHRQRIGYHAVRGGLIAGALLPLLVMIFLRDATVTDNKYNIMTDQLRAIQLYLPERNSRYTGSFEIHHKGNLRYSSPSEPYFFYATGDGPLPCTSHSFMELIERKYGLLPQLRTGELSDGFYSKRIR